MRVVDDLENVAEKANRRAIISQWVKHVTGQTIGATPIRDAAGDAELDVMTEAHRVEVNRLQTLLTAIRAKQF